MHAARAAELLWANEFGFVSILPHRHCPVAHKRVGNTVAAASSPQEPGLEAFESLIAERRFICTQVTRTATAAETPLALTPTAAGSADTQRLFSSVSPALHHHIQFAVWQVLHR